MSKPRSLYQGSDAVRARVLDLGAARQHFPDQIRISLSRCLEEGRVICPSGIRRSS
jgi:hypothetical protein